MRVLFICTGNTCRSPMAEGLAKIIFPGDYSFKSAGINAFDGDKVSLKAVQALREKGIDIQHHQAVRVTAELLASVDIVIAMTNSHKEYLISQYPELAANIQTLGDWAKSGKEVPDPWGGSQETYQYCANEIEKMLRDIKTNEEG